MQGRELSFAVRLPVVASLTGRLCLVLAALTLAPLAAALLAWDPAFAWRAGAAVLALAALGRLLSRIRAPRDVQRNEALVVVAATFLIASLTAVPPLTAGGLAPLDAFFEAVSGVTTTGLTVATPLAGRSAPFLFTRAWLQWYGGLGVVVLSLALLIRPGTQARRISAATGEADAGDLVAGTRGHARGVVLVYGTLTLVGLAAMLATGTSLFESLLHVLTSVSTGGFASSDRSLAALAPAARWVALGISLAGALPLALYYRAARQRDWRLPLRDPEVAALLAAALLVAAALTLILRLEAAAPWPAAVGDGCSLALSAQSTTGFSTLTVGGLPAAAKGVLLLAMFTGGCLGSTAGGVKWIRLVLLGKAVRGLVGGTSLPRHAVVVPRLRGRRVVPEEFLDAALVFLLFAATIALSWLAFLAAGRPPLDSLLDVVSATGTVGLSTGVTGPGLPSGLKLLLCADMLLGRLEMLALLVLVYPPTWFGKRRSSP